MATVQNLVVNLLGNAKQLASTIRQSKAEVSGLSDFVNGQVVGLGSKVTGLVAGLTGGFSLGLGVKLAADFEAMQTQMQVLTGDVKVASKLISDLRTMGASTPFETADLVQATTTLLAFGRNAQDAFQDLDMLSNVAAGDANKLKSLSTVFGQIAAAGKLTGGDLLQLINQGFNPLTQIAARSGESVSELKDRMSEGRVTFSEVRQAFVDATSAGGLFFGMNARMSKTLGGLYSTLKDEVSNALLEMGQAIVENLDLKDVLARTTAGIKEWKTTLVGTFGTALNLLRAYGPLLVSTGIGILVLTQAMNVARKAEAAWLTIKAAGLALTGVGVKQLAVAAVAVAAFGTSLYAMGGYSDGSAQELARVKDELRQVGTELKTVDQAGDPAAQKLKAIAAAAEETKKATSELLTPAQQLSLRLREISKLNISGSLKDKLAFKAVDDSTGVFTQIRKLQDEIALLTGEATEAQLAVRDLLQKGAPSGAAGAVGDLMQRRDDLKKQEEERKRMADEAKRAKEQHEEMLKGRAQSVIDATRTPMEQFQKRLQELRELLAQGLIDDDTFQRGMKQAQEDLKKAEKSKAGDGRAANAITRGSAEAAQAIAAASNGNPKSKMEQIAGEHLQIAREQNAALQVLVRKNPLQIKERKLEAAG